MKRDRSAGGQNTNQTSSATNEYTGYGQQAAHTGPYFAANGYAQPQAGYGQAQPGFTAGQMNYAQAQQGYAAGQTGYGQAQPGFTAGQMNYAQAQQSYTVGQMNYAQPQQGYTAGQMNYAQAQQGYTAGQMGYAQPQQGYAAGQTGYPQAQQGYTAGQAGYGQQGYTGQRGFTQPQQPYAQSQGWPGYAQMTQPPVQGQQAAPQQAYAYPQQGYPVVNGSAQSYNPFGQMGRQTAAQQNVQTQVPLNTSGYVPPPVQVRKAPFTLDNINLIIVCALMAILFAVGMFVPDFGVLKWVFIAFSLLSIVFFWVKPDTMASNKRICYTIVFGLLSLVALVTGLRETGVLGGGTAAPGKGPGTQVTSAVATNAAVSGAQSDTQGGQIVSVFTPAPATETPAADNKELVKGRLEEFFYYWSGNRTEDMLTLCAPSWKSNAENPGVALFNLVGNRIPLDQTYENITGTENDTSRTITLTATIDRGTGKTPSKYRMNVRMVFEVDNWYVDPESLKSYEAAETTDPAEAATPTPTASPAVNGNTVLYYNPDGGTKYHLDPYCVSTHKKFLPFKGKFTYAEVNDPKYKELSPCNVCAAPLR